MRSIRNEVLEIFFEEGGPPDGTPVMILHGWPDAPRGWKLVRHRLESEGCRTITPYLRGTQPTRFLDSEAPRDGSAAALTRDAMDLADSPGLEQFFVVGHDWGARMAYTMTALYPERLRGGVSESATAGRRSLSSSRSRRGGSEPPSRLAEKAWIATASRAHDATALRALCPMASRLAIVSAESCRDAAAMFSRRCVTDEVPGMSRMFGER